MYTKPIKLNYKFYTLGIMNKTTDIHDAGINASPLKVPESELELVRVLAEFLDSTVRHPLILALLLHNVVFHPFHP